MQNKFPEDFSLLSVDAEHMDYEVLLGLDFDIFKPRIIVTEDTDLYREKQDQKDQLLRDNGYVLVKKIACNSVWVKKGLVSQVSS